MAQKMVTYFNDFLKNIRLTDNQVNELKSAHTTLRNRLMADEDLKDIIVTTFLQGSYRRSTAVRPKQGKRSDVDIVVVTKLDKEEVTREEALNVFEPFLEKYYEGKYRKQGRSWGIEMTHDAFYESVCEAAVIARNAYEAETVQESADLWRKLFGNKFPEAPKQQQAVFTKREEPSVNLTGGRFA